MSEIVFVKYNFTRYLHNLVSNLFSSHLCHLDWGAVVTSEVKLWSWRIFGTSAAAPFEFAGSEAHPQKVDEDLGVWHEGFTNQALEEDTSFTWEILQHT